ncbi:MAG: triose-phosphate isomerase [Synergistaceae bacterium]|jgi:triosephosphate isomerase|nr:triose-phosphate isomerase [Synergistaceae bacterium]
MRKKFIAGNWKMFKGPEGTSEFISRFVDELLISKNVTKAIDEKKLEIAIFPPSISITRAIELKTNAPILIGAQNMYWQENGAFTGEISASMLKEVGCTHIIIGHSERRNIFLETNDIINKKLTAAVNAGLVSVLCVGELLDDRKSANTFSVIKKQLLDALKGINPQIISDKIIIAYEPVWAIGTGITANNIDAQEVCSYIRNLISEAFGEKIANKLIVLYGGSVKPNNTASFLIENDIDGVLVGGASLEIDSFMNIIKAAL